MEEKISDEKLVEEYLLGNKIAFEELLERYLKQIYGFLFRLVGNQAVAEDLSQDTFLKAWKNLKRFDQERKFGTWLFAIAKNTAFDWFKKKREIPFSTFTDEEGESRLNNITDENILPDEILERKNIAEELEKMLEKIPLHYRAILLLHYKEDFSLHEIEEILDEPYNTIKSRYRRALLELRKLFKN
jgi:RNA polymerase sigma-70 factor (ECF subfamily)